MSTKKSKISGAIVTAFTSGLIIAAAIIIKNKDGKYAGHTPLPLDPAVRTGKLANGFTYYIRRNKQPQKRLIFYLANKVGSILEDDDQRGLAHFIEHMSFNGTTHFPHNKLVDYLQKNGVRFGADINAYTNFDETVYQLPLPTNNPEIVKNGLQIMRDWAQGALLDSAEIDKERGVVLEEKRLLKGSGDRMQRKYFPILTNGSRYAIRTPIGTDTVLNNFKPSTIKRFYHDWYRPNLQALIVVGDINVDDMERAIKLKFGDLKNPVNEKPRKRYTVPLNTDNKFIALTDPEITSTTMQILIKQPGLANRTANDYRQQLVRALYNSMINIRYIYLLRTATPPFLQGGVKITDFIGGVDVFDATVIAKPGELKKGFKALWLEIERVKRFGFTETELAREKENYLSRMEEALNEKDKTNSTAYVKEYLDNFLNGTAVPGISYEYDLVKNQLAGVTLSQVNELAKTAVKNNGRDILILAPEKYKATLPDEASVNKWLNEAQTTKLEPYKDDISKEQMLKREPIPGKIVSENRDTALNITTITLSNGVKVLLKPTNFKNNQIVFSGFAPGGTSLYSKQEFQSAANASLFGAFGAGNFNPTQMGKFLTGKQAGAQAYIAERLQGIKGGADPKDLETALQMVYAYYTEPRKDKELFDGVIAQTKAALANRENDPKSVFQDTVSAIMGGYSVRSTGPTIEKLEQIDFNRAYEIYKERFGNAAGGTFVFVGSIDTVKIKPLLEKYLGSLPATGKPAQPKNTGVQTPGGKITKIVYKGTEPKATVVLVWHGRFDYSVNNKFTFNALKECLQIRILERLREEESGIYSPETSLQMTKYPNPSYGLVVQFACAPDNVKKLIASAQDEVSKLRTNGPLQINLDKFKAEVIRDMETQLRTNGFWLSYLSSQIQDDNPLDEITHFRSQLKNITTADAKEVAAKYLNDKNYIQVVLMPEIK